MNKEKTYVCRKLKLYSYLIKNGFKIEYSRPDKYDDSRMVWIFKDSPELQEAVTKYYSNKN